MKRLLFFLLTGSLFLMISCQQQAVNSVNIVPEPVQVEIQKGYFSLSEKSLLLFEGTDCAFEQYVRQYFSDYLGLSFSQEKGNEKYGTVIFRLNTDYDKTVGEEGYRLEVNKEGITLTANTHAGLVYALQSLYQLTPADVAKNSPKGIQIPQVKIVDYPRFEWRGSHRDVSRHFFDVEHIKRHLDLMALYKMNKFHWHLTDDHGWRLEIDKYPKLMEIGAWRVDRPGISWAKLKEQEYAPKEGEPSTYGGYYTKEQVRDIINYAAQRGIEVIPEIEIPGHCSEILAAYPEFGCDDFPYYVQIGPYWPPKAILCGGNDKVMTFLKDVIDEMAELFPSEYIHIGGDEAFIESETFKHNWELCPKCQKRIKDLKLKNPEALQGWMICEIEQHAKKHGKKIIGWDEILEGGVTADAIVMYWRGWLGNEPLMEAAHKGNLVISTPTTHCYYDYNQIEEDPNQEGPKRHYLPLEKAYAFDPIPEGLPEEAAKLIIGGQCNLWAEYLYTPKESEYMLLPRLLALSESVWSPVDRKCWEHFVKKLPEQKKRLSALGYNYCDEVGLIREAKFNKNKSDVGNPKMKGSFTYDFANDMYTLRGGGYDMWYERDEFFMVWQEVTGDFKLSAKVAFEGEGAHLLRKMGLMIRESLDEDARHANVSLHGNMLAALQYRMEKGGESKDIRSANQTNQYLIYPEGLAPEQVEENTPIMPDHLMLERVGNKIIMKTGIGSYSDQPDATVEIDLPKKCYVGLFICSHSVDLLETGYFWNVKLE